MPKKMPCEVYSRIVGYLRPVSAWNVAKKHEFKERKTYEVKKEKNEECLNMVSSEKSASG